VLPPCFYWASSVAAVFFGGGGDHNSSLRRDDDADDTILRSSHADGPRCDVVGNYNKTQKFDRLFKSFVSGEDDVSSRKARFKFIPNMVKVPFLVSAALRTLGGMRCVVVVAVGHAC
jgi:hypothetical protein